MQVPRGGFHIKIHCGKGRSMFSRRNANQKYLDALGIVESPFPREGNDMELTSAEYAELPEEMTHSEYVSMKEGMEQMWAAVADMHEKVTEMHKFTSGIAQALNNPMLKSMLPPQIRDMM